MEQTDKQLIIEDEDGKRYVREILFTYESAERKAKYVFFFDPEDKAGEVQVLRYADDGSLEEIIDDDEYAEVEEVFNSYSDEHEEE